MNRQVADSFKGRGQNRKGGFFRLTAMVISFVLPVLALPEAAFAESCEVEKIIGATVSSGAVYRIQVRREAQDMYKIEGQNVWIKTRMCMHWQSLSPEEAILEIDDAYLGYNIGELHFLD